MSKFEKFITAAKFVAATSIAATSAQGCADDCEVIADDPNAPVLEDADAVSDYCEDGKEVTCLDVEESEDGEKVDCYARVYQCGSASTRKNVEELFSSGEGNVCIGGSGDLQANL